MCWTIKCLYIFISVIIALSAHGTADEFEEETTVSPKQQETCNVGHLQSEPSKTWPSPDFACTCHGTSSRQACPKWKIIEGLEVVDIMRNETKRSNKHHCTAYLQIVAKPARFGPEGQLSLKLQCLALNQVIGTVGVQRSDDGAFCELDRWCLYYPLQNCTNNRCRCPHERPYFDVYKNRCVFGNPSLGLLSQNSSGLLILIGAGLAITVILLRT